MHPKGANSINCRLWDSALKKPWLALGGPFLSSFAQMGLENGLVGPLFRTAKLFSRPGGVTIGQEP